MFATRRLQSLAPVVASLALLALMLWLSPQFGYTWDERFQQAYGDEIWRYLHGLLPESSFETTDGMQYLYSGFAEVVAVAVQKLWTADTYIVRHAVDAVFGWLGIVWCGRLAARLFGRPAGWLAAAMLVLSPRYFGDAMNNSKDVPFAVCTLIALYYIVTISERPPFLTWRHAAKIAGAIVLAVNVRPIGLVLIAYTGAVLGALVVRALFLSERPKPWRSALAAGAWLAAIAIVVVPLGTLFWPWAQVRPFARPIQAFFESSGGISTTAGYPVLYAGQDLSAGTLPWHYLPVWLAISTPPVVLIGLALSAVLLWRRSTATWPAVLALAAFPCGVIAMTVIRRPSMYDAIRQLLFIVPPLFVLSAAGWIALVRSTRGRVQAGVLAVLLAGLAEPLVFQIRNHPNQNVYFSPIIGGPRGAFGRFEMDYWANSILQAVKWSRDLANQSGMPLVVSGHPWEAVWADSQRYHQLVFAPRDSHDYHVDIRVLRGPSASVRELATRGDVLHVVRAADGAPLSVVIAGPAYPALERQLARPHGIRN